MSFFEIVRVELIKLLKKRISLLLLLFLVPSVLFGVGMSLGLSFFVSDGDTGVEAVGESLSGFGFAVNMLEQGKFVIFLVVIILAAYMLSGELENGQLKQEIIRICGRKRIVTAKYIALLLLVFAGIITNLLWSLFIYGIFVGGTNFGNGQLYDEFIVTHMGYVFFSLLGIGVVVGVTFLFGTRLKTFPCFAVSYIVWFASLYTEFSERIKLLIPYNMPNFILENAGVGINYGKYVGVYAGYCIVFVLASGVIIRASDIKV